MLRVENEGTKVLGFDKGDESYTIEIDICKDPYCSCGIVDLVIRSEKDTPNTESLKILLDNQEKELLFDFDSKVSPFLISKGNQMLDYLNAELSEDDWQLLSYFSTIVKGDYVEYGEYDLDGWGYILPEEHMLNEDLLIAVHDVFSAMEYLSIEYKGDEFSIEDYYCKKLKCDCNTANLKLLKNDKEVGTIEYNYDSGEMSSSPYNKVMSEFISDYYPLGLRLKVRSMKIKAVHVNTQIAFKSKMLELANKEIAKKKKAEKKKIGRNEPCPCGSGEKYKNCCGNNVISINRNNK